MNDRIFLDTNVLVYLYDQDSPKSKPSRGLSWRADRWLL